jgi:hypothetical protein
MNMKKGTIGGTLTVLLANITSPDILKTAVLAAIGAVVSSLVTLLIRKLAKKEEAQK